MNETQGRMEAAQMSATDFQEEILKTFDGGEYHLRSAYRGYDRRVIFYHDQCGLTWRTTPERFLKGGHRCPQCTTVSNHRMRDLVRDALGVILPLYGSKSLICDHFFGSGPTGKTGRQLSYDFWLPDLQILVDADADVDEEPWGPVNGTDFRLRSMVTQHDLKREWATQSCIDHIFVPRNVLSVPAYLDRAISRVQSGRRLRKY